MRTIEYLFGDTAIGIWPAVIVALIVAVLCAALSPLVVLRRLAFVGQGVSHAAFAGVGLALVVGLGASGAGDPRVLLVVTATCVAAALGIARLADNRGESSDSAIGIVLVTAMAVGFVLIQVAAKARGGLPSSLSVESVLFGSIVRVGESEAWTAGVVAAAVLALLWSARHRVLFWAFDEVGAVSVGVSERRCRALLLVLLAVVIVLAMRLAGVVLTTALLVLPGATALQLTRTLYGVWSASLAVAVVGTVAGLVLSFEADWPAGPSIVLVLASTYAIARILRGRRVR